MKELKRGIIAYEKIGAGRIFGKWKFYDKELEKKYGHLSKEELDRLVFGEKIK